MSGSLPQIETVLREAREAMQNGAFGEAEGAYKFVLAALPLHPEANHNLSLVLVNTNRVSEAERRMEKMVKAAPNDAAAHLLLGRITALTGKTNRSIFLLRRAMDLYPGDVNLWLDVIALMGKQERPADAERAAQAAIQNFPEEADLYLQAGLAWANNNDTARARFWFDLVLQVDPNHAPGLFQLAGIDEAEERFGHAIRNYQRARELDVEKRLKVLPLGDLMLKHGLFEQAIPVLREWLATHPDDGRAITNLLTAVQYEPGVTIASLRQEHQVWERAFGAPLRSTWQVHTNNRATDRKLRVGLVSSDLRQHSVGYTTVSGIEALDRNAICLACYTDYPVQDAIENRVRARADLWRDTRGVSHEQLAARIREDQIDILIDMSGHTSHTRLLTFARRPAPIQLTWAGWFGTTGCEAIDGLLVDATLAPPEDDAEYREKLWRLPDGYLCYDRPGDAPGVTLRDTTGVLRLAAFHNPAKINQDVVALWARIINALAPEPVVLHFSYRGYNEPDLQQRLIDWFAPHGVQAKQLSFAGWLPRADYLQSLNAMDIGLDPFPYSGGAITCDALWMGVPTITLPGVTVAGRHSATHLHAAGLDEFIARDQDDYVAKVVALAQDRPKLSTLQKGLREHVSASALCDAPRFAAGFVAVMRAAWQDYLGRSVEQA